MSQDRPPTGSESGSGGGGGSGEPVRESLPHLTEVVPDFAELSPFYPRPNSAPPPDPNRPSISTATREFERQYSELPAFARPSEPSLPPLRGAMIRTHPGAGRLPHQNPFEITLEHPPTRPIIPERRDSGDRPQIPTRQTSTVAEIPTRSPESAGRVTELRQPERRPRPSLYDPVHEPPHQPPPPPPPPLVQSALASPLSTRRASRSHLPPLEIGPTVESAREAPPPYQPPLPPIRTGPSSSIPAPAVTSPRYTPYPASSSAVSAAAERPYEPLPPRRRFSQTYAPPPPPPPRDVPLRTTSPYRSPTTGRIHYPPEAYYHSTYPRTARRPSLEPTYLEERRQSLRAEPVRFPPPLPYSHSYPPSLPYEYSGARGYHDPYHGYVEYPPDSRRLSQQEPGEQVTHLGVPERSYRPPMLGPTSPSSIRVQPPHGAGMPPTTGKRRGNLPKESKDKLKQWLALHVEHPYPTEEEKKELAAEAGMTMGQINNWFINARRRTLPRIPGTGRQTSPSASRTLRRRPGDT